MNSDGGRILNEVRGTDVGAGVSTRCLSDFPEEKGLYEIVVHNRFTYTL